MTTPRRAKPKKAKIERIAAACTGIVFVVLLIKTLAGEGEAPTPVQTAVAETRASGKAPDSEVRKPTARLRGESPEIRFLPEPDDSGRVVVPSNPFRPSPELMREIRGETLCPTQAPSPAPKENRIEFKLKGILTDFITREHVALVDDRHLRIGDRHREYTVVDIDECRVVLEKDTDRRTLHMEPK